MTSSGLLHSITGMSPISILQLIKDDLITVEFEAVFSGAAGQPPPRRDMDRLVDGAKNTLEIDSAANTQGERFLHIELILCH